MTAKEIETTRRALEDSRRLAFTLNSLPQNKVDALARFLYYTPEQLAEDIKALDAVLDSIKEAP